MRAWAASRDWRGLTERLDNAGDDARERLDKISDWRHELVSIERDVFVTMRNSGRISEDVLRELQYDLDLEESLLDRRMDDATGHLSQLTAARTTGTTATIQTATGRFRLRPPDHPPPDHPTRLSNRRHRQVALPTSPGSRRSVAADAPAGRIGTARAPRRGTAASPPRRRAA